MKNILKFVWLFFGLFFSIVWLYIQMLIWQPWRPRGPLKSGAWGGRPTCHPQTPALGLAILYIFTGEESNMHNRYLTAVAHELTVSISLLRPTDDIEENPVVSIETCQYE
jgi:hypothetical protein